MLPASLVPPRKRRHTADDGQAASPLLQMLAGANDRIAQPVAPVQPVAAMPGSRVEGDMPVGLLAQAAAGNGRHKKARHGAPVSAY